MVPNGWINTKLGDLVSIASGIAPSALTLSEAGKYPYVKVEDMNNCSKYQLDSRTFTDDVLRCIPKGSVIFPKRGAAIMNNKVRIAAADLYLDSNMMSLYPGDKLATEYLYYRLVKEELHRIADTSTIPQINNKHIIPYRFLLPPLSEQKKIAQILSTWDKAIIATEQLLANSQKLKKALMQQLLTGSKRLLGRNKVRFRGEWRVSRTPYKYLPKDWGEITLSQVSSFITKGATPTTYGFEWQDEGIPFVRSECVGENGFKKSGLAFICTDAHKVMKRSKVFSGDVLITITGNVGRVCKLPESIPEANINQHIAKITLSTEEVDCDFVYHCLQDRKYRTSFERITTGQAYPQVSLVQIRDALIPLPPKAEQQKIATVLSAANQEITILQKKIDALKQEKKSLMQQLLTGKRRVGIQRGGEI